MEPPAPPPPLAEVKTEVLKSADSRTEIIAPLPKPEPRRETQAVAAPPKGKGMLIGAGVAVALLAAVGWFLLRPKPEVVPPGPEPPTPVHAPVATVAIAGESGPVAVGRTRQLGVVIRDAGGAELSARSVDWSSSDPAVAEVSKNGAVTGNKAGSATITATSEGKSATLVLTVEAGGADLPAAVASVAIAGAGKAIEVGETVQLNAVAKDTKGAPLGDRTVVWSTGEPGVALVSSGGLVTAVGPGTVTISASSEGKSADAKVIVNAPKPVPKPPEPAPEPTPVALASVTVSPPAATVVAGQTIQLSVVAKDAKGKVVNDRVLAWSSDDQHIATVTNSGLVQGVAEGSATITVSAEGKSGRVKLTVTPAAKPIVPVAGVGIVAIGKSLKVGETVTWSAVARDSKGNSLNDRAISWTSSAPQVATVSAGVITAVGPGTTEIRAESEGKSVVERITVAAAPSAAAPTSTSTRSADESSGASHRRFGAGASKGGGGRRLAELRHHAGRDRSVLGGWQRPHCDRGHVGYHRTHGGTRSRLRSPGRRPSGVLGWRCGGAAWRWRIGRNSECSGGRWRTQLLDDYRRGRAHVWTLGRQGLLLGRRKVRAAGGWFQQ